MTHHFYLHNSTGWSYASRALGSRFESSWRYPTWACAAGSEPPLQGGFEDSTSYRSTNLIVNAKRSEQFGSQPKPSEFEPRHDHHFEGECKAPRAGWFSPSA